MPRKCGPLPFLFQLHKSDHYRMISLYRAISTLTSILEYQTIRELYNDSRSGLMFTSWSGVSKLQPRRLYNGLNVDPERILNELKASDIFPLEIADI